MTKIKICGLFREQDIEYVNEALPDYAGFILHFPKSHRNIDLGKAKALRDRLVPEIRPVCVFVDQPLETVIRSAEYIQPDILQLHGSESNKYIEELKEKTGLTVWKAFRVRNSASMTEAMESSADLVLLDNGYGTGEVFDWSKVESLLFRPARNSRRFSQVFREKSEWNGVCLIREANSAWANASYCHAPRGGVDSNAESFRRPFILAGGLTPGNIPDAVLRLCPAAVDISSGVETNRQKDRDKVLAAVRAARSC